MLRPIDFIRKLSRNMQRIRADCHLKKRLEKEKRAWGDKDKITL